MPAHSLLWGLTNVFEIFCSSFDLCNSSMNVSWSLPPPLCFIVRVPIKNKKSNFVWSPMSFFWNPPLLQIDQVLCSQQARLSFYWCLSCLPEVRGLRYALCDSSPWPFPMCVSSGGDRQGQQSLPEMQRPLSGWGRNRGRDSRKVCPGAEKMTLSLHHHISSGPFFIHTSTASSQASVPAHMHVPLWFSEQVSG